MPARNPSANQRAGLGAPDRGASHLAETLEEAPEYLCPAKRACDDPVRRIHEMSDCVGEPRRGSARFWTTREIEVLRRVYPTHGSDGCLPLLAGRTRAAIYAKAGQLGLDLTQAPIRMQHTRYKSSPEIDEAIRRVYSAPMPRRAVIDLARSVMRPKGWVSKRAAQLGLVPPRFKELPWSEAEDAIVYAREHRHPQTVQQALKRAGYTRTLTAVRVRMTRLGVSARTNITSTHVTATQLARLFGIDPTVVSKHWIRHGLLPATARGTERKPQQGGDMLAIKWADVRRFVFAYPHLIDLRKVHPQRIWFLSLMAGDDGRMLLSKVVDGGME